MFFTLHRGYKEGPRVAWANACMDKDRNTDIHLTPLDGPISTVELEHKDQTIPYTEYKYPVIREKTKVIIPGSEISYLWKGEWMGHHRLHLESSEDDGKAVATIKEKKHSEADSSKYGTLRLHGGQKISVDLVVISALIVRARSESSS